MRIRYLLFYSVIFIYSLAIAEIDQQKYKALEEVHQSLFDFYLPKDEYLNKVQKVLDHKNEFYESLNRDYDQWVSKSWEEHKDENEFLFLLSPLALQDKSSWEFLPFVQDIKNVFPDVYEHGFSSVDYNRKEQFLVYLERHADNTLRQYVSTLRKIYVSMAYLSPFANQVAGIEKQGSLLEKKNNIQLTIPESKLYINDDHIMHKDGEIDYLIIGSGPAGSLIAYELSQLKPESRILVVEKGPFVVPGILDTESNSQLMESNNKRTDTTGAIFIRNGSVVGGGTTVNLDLAFSPMLPSIRNNMQHWIDQKWISGDLFHLNESLNDWYYLEKAYNYVSSKIGTRTVEDSEINLNNQILLNASKNARTYDLNSKSGNKNEIHKISAVDSFLLPALQGDGCQSNVSLISDAKVTRIIFNDSQNSKVTGIELTIGSSSNFEDKFLIKDLNKFYINQLSPNQEDKYVIQAKNIILSAGALGSAELLLRSDIDNDNIGKGIVIHPSMGICARFDKKINPLEGLSTSVYAPSEDIRDGYFFEAMSAEPGFLAFLHQGSGKQILDVLENYNCLGGFGIMLVDSVNKENKVSINPETNLVEIAYKLSDHDKYRFREAIKCAVEMLLDQGAIEVFIPTIEPIISNELKYFSIMSKDQVDRAVKKLKFMENENFISSAHMQASNKIGSNPKDCVVSHNFKVWNTKVSGSKEIPNLYVVDSSIFPSSVGANPMQSIYTIAKLFVDKMICKKLVDEYCN